MIIHTIYLCDRRRFLDMESTRKKTKAKPKARLTMEELAQIHKCADTLGRKAIEVSCHVQGQGQGDVHLYGYWSTGPHTRTCKCIDIGIISIAPHPQHLVRVVWHISIQIPDV